MTIFNEAGLPFFRFNFPETKWVSGKLNRKFLAHRLVPLSTTPDMEQWSDQWSIRAFFSESDSDSEPEELEDPEGSDSWSVRAEPKESEPEESEPAEESEPEEAEPVEIPRAPSGPRGPARGRKLNRRRRERPDPLVGYEPIVDRREWFTPGELSRGRSRARARGEDGAWWSDLFTTRRPDAMMWSLQFRQELIDEIDEHDRRMRDWERAHARHCSSND
jgi:hypothetical protein